MADAELVRVLDYILNRSDENTIEAIAAAVVRRKRDLSLFGSAGLPDPKSWARRVAADVNVNASLEGIRGTVRNMVSEMLKREAPELSDGEREELLNAWIPSQRAGTTGAAARWTAVGDANMSGSGTSGKILPPEVLGAMVRQFVAFSQGTLDSKEDAALRKELGSWPERYWDAFPALIKSLVTEYLQGELDEASFAAKLRASIQIASGT